MFSNLGKSGKTECRHLHGIMSNVSRLEFDPLDVYRRQKHPFLSPPVTTLPSERFHMMLQGTLRGPALASLPFFDQKKVAALLDQLPAMTEADRVAWDPVLMSVLSACVLHQGFKL
jgi:asparagine synthase (glutamine-hydrolysing)